MIIYFSGTTKGFYQHSWQSEYQAAGNWPPDVVKLTEEEKKNYWKKSPPVGMVIGTINGHPAWINAPLPAPLTSDELAAKARQYRDFFIEATDPMMVSDYSIDDMPLTSEQRRELAETRLAFKTWPTQENWPRIELPDIPYWLLIEAVNQGYRVPVWPAGPAE
ncbi:phage tail protein [Yersinia pseudotuberculosis]|uniref:phage tail protein n=1 Tax=Yersinia pseudotuberculosis TaxID=633 RepID=UPI0005E157E7|nr:phage tail protein [Yersinia pseudotuberculosis]CND23623.1 putative tail fiber assembly protein [Yersinia pseudotuberculosis]